MQIYEEFRRRSPKVTGSLIRLRQEAFKEGGAVPAKYKILAALTAVVVTKCEPCIIAYVKMADKAGVSEEELVEFLNVAVAEAGCPGEQWALKALRVYLDVRGGAKYEEEACCQE